MSAERDRLQRVQNALYCLGKGLRPHVEARMKAKYGPAWIEAASRASGSGADCLDEYALLKTMMDNWKDVFAGDCDPSSRHRVRAFLSFAMDARNAVAHLTKPLEDDEALRFLDSIHQVLRAVGATAAEIDEVKSLYDAQRRDVVASSPSLGDRTKLVPEPSTERPRILVGKGLSTRRP
jgi:hypothetical protein